MILLVALFLISALLATAAATMLGLRLRAAGLQMEACLPADIPGVLSGLAPTLRRHLATSLLPAADHRGPIHLPVRAREAHDPYRDVGALLDRIVQAARGEGLTDREELVKAIHQLQASLGLSTQELGRILGPVLTELKGARFLDKRVGEVEQVAPGTAIELDTMWPLSQGTRVRQPLGVVIRDTEGKVLSKAKVLCG